MEVQKCTGPCKQEKPVSEFSKKGKYKDGRQRYQNYCKICHSAYLKEHYNANKDYYKDKAAKRNKKTRSETLPKVIQYLREHPCVDCGESNPLFLEFDHVRGEKKRPVSEMAWNGTSWSGVLKEIEKCEVRCMKCHRAVTLARKESLILDMLTEEELNEVSASLQTCKKA